jgi:hypothetical protein
MSFLVTEYGKGASSQMSQPAPGKVGVIAVTFAPDYPQPPVQSAPTREAGSRPGNETGVGPAQKVALEEAKRTIRPVSDISSVRYTR